MQINIPICYFPFKKMIVDDNNMFSQSMRLKLNKKKTITFDSAKEALHFLTQEYQSKFKKSDLISLEENSNNSNQQTISINFKKINDTLCSEKYDEIDILLVDYHMPELNGIDFLKKIKDFPFKKILITGENDYKVAINAFNDGLVDAYLRKDEVDFQIKLPQLIAELEWKYFIDLSNSIVTVQKNTYYYLASVDFYKIFIEIIGNYDIVSFCLVDMAGTFKLVDYEGNVYFLVVRNTMQFKNLISVAKEDSGSCETIEKLEKMQFIPFFGEDIEFWQVPAKEWDNYLYSAKGVEPDLFWALIRNGQSI